MSILGNNTDVMDNSNASTRYYWDLTGFSLTNENTITIQYQYTGQSGFSTATTNVQGTTLQSVADALNTLNIGTFFLTTSGASTFLNNYNQYVAYGSLNIVNNTSLINTSFVVGTGFVGAAGSQGNEAFALQTDGKILVGGSFSSYRGTTANRIVRINTDGSIDTTFVTGTGFNNVTTAISLQTDGKIIVGGIFTSYNGTGANRIIRLNSDGSIDGTFVYGTGFNASVNTTKIQSDGKILVGGTFTSYNGTGANRIVRLTTLGAVDGTFVYGTGFDNSVTDIAIQSDGKIVVTGAFLNYNGTGSVRLIRLTTLGAVDGTLVVGTGFNSVPNGVSIQSDGKIIVVGNFTTYQGTSANYIIRLTTLGAIDTSFVYGTGFNNSPVSTEIQSDGKILVGGNFTTYQGTSANYIIRLNTDGSIDTSFAYGTGFDALTSTIGLNYSQMYIMGAFSTFQGQTYNGIISLNQ
jgi:uncharacterized delta-60 repeat protein